MSFNYSSESTSISSCTWKGRTTGAITSLGRLTLREEAKAVEEMGKVTALLQNSPPQ